MIDAGITSEKHYLTNGRREARPYLDLAFYVTNNFLPSNFDEINYLNLNPDVRNQGVRAIDHYLQYGYSEGRLWN